jgi:hypothetical protein
MNPRLLRFSGILIVTLALLMQAASFQAAAAPPGNSAFSRTWARTDKPVADGIISRTWMWGPEGFTMTGMEPYTEGPGGQRTVQYFDKSRMEITDPAADPSSPWFVTNGLLVGEMMLGVIQRGHAEMTPHPFGPAQVNVAGDFDDPAGPTYSTFGAVRHLPAHELGAVIAERLHRNGIVSYDAGLAARGVVYGAYDDVTEHSIAQPFWAFMNSSGTVWDGRAYRQDSLFENPFYATGRPVTEAYWARVRVGGTEKDVLTQCFERRCLTYTPDNPAGWQVEAGNVGLHYYIWRYNLSAGLDVAAGLSYYWSSYESWTHFPDGAFNSADDRWLGGPNGEAARAGVDYWLRVIGGVNAWAGALGGLPTYGDVIASVNVLGPLSGTGEGAGDRGCLLYRANESGDDLRLYALCLRNANDFIAFYYEMVGGVIHVQWIVPPGTRVSTRAPGAWNNLSIAALGHEMWFYANGATIWHGTHDAGPLSGAVGVGVQRGSDAPGYSDFVFMDLRIHAAH